MPLNHSNFQAAQQLADRMSSWGVAYSLIRNCCVQNPVNTDRFIVLLKVRLINKLYSTSIRAEYQVACEIARRGQELDADLQQGSSNAIQLIAECGRGNRRERSFASKFAHFHQPTRFAIRDRYVNRALDALHLPPTPPPGANIAQDYLAFHDKVKAIAEEWHLEITQVDQYLWLRGAKEIARHDGEEELSIELREVMANNPGLWNQL